MYAHKLDPGKKVRLDRIDPRDTGDVGREASFEKLAGLSTELHELQELFFAAADRSLLLVLQGRDTSGKDGTIKSVFANIDPQGCRIAAFKAPTEDELAHDFLWRIHRETPARGRIGIFNRSHYEDVLVVRVHELVPPSIWRRRYQQINEFERILHQNDTTIVKCYLHISREEQEERLLAREKDPVKAWKLSVGDWRERDRWDDYTRAYEDALEACGTDHAPWYVIPADHKWFRNLAVMELLVRTLRPHREDWEKLLVDRGKKARAEIEAFRRQKDRR